MISYAVAVGSSVLAGRLFGQHLELLACIPGRRLGGVLEDFDDPQTVQHLAEAEALITGWDTPPLTAAVLDRAPQLRLVVHAGGGVNHLFPDGRASVQVIDVGDVNAIPVAEFTVAMIVLANKQVFRGQHLYRQRRAFIDRERALPGSGNVDRTIGVISASRTGRLVMQMLRAYPSLRVLLHDPHPSARHGLPDGVTHVPLDVLMSESDVVTVHAPVLTETVRMIGSDQLALMKDGATFINTARGVVVDHAALELELVSGRIHAILDVTDPEPLPAGSPLYDLPNVVLTPHLAGSMGTELRRIGAAVADHLVVAGTARPEVPAR